MHFAVTFSDSGHFLCDFPDLGRSKPHRQWYWGQWRQWSHRCMWNRYQGKKASQSQKFVKNIFFQKQYSFTVAAAKQTLSVGGCWVLKTAVNNALGKLASGAKLYYSNILEGSGSLNPGSKLQYVWLSIWNNFGNWWPCLFAPYTYYENRTQSAKSVQSSKRNRCGLTFIILICRLQSGVMWSR